MREKLAEREGMRGAYHGVFVRFGVKSGWRGRTDHTLLLKDIIDSNGQPICDHLWFNLTKAFAALNLQTGDVVYFDARVRDYVKGYRGYRDDVWDVPVELDYKLSFPTRVSKVTNEAPLLEQDAETESAACRTKQI